MKKLFLDDVRRAPKGFELVTTVQEFMDKIESDEYSIISLDFNINDGLEGDCAVNQIIMQWRDGKLTNLKKVIIHSANKKGRKIMHDKLTQMTSIPVEVKPLMHESNLPAKDYTGF